MISTYWKKLVNYWDCELEIFFYVESSKARVYGIDTKEIERIKNKYGY